MPGILKENSEPNVDEEGNDGDGDVVFVVLLFFFLCIPFVLDLLLTIMQFICKCYVLTYLYRQLPQA